MVPYDFRLRRSIVAVAGLSVLAAGGLAALEVVAGQAPSTPPEVPPAAVETDRVAVGPLLDRKGAWLTLGDAASKVRIRFDDLQGRLYRVSTAPDAGVRPVVSSRDGRVLVRLRQTAGEGLDEVRIVLNRNVSWDIRLPEGAGEQQLNLRNGRVRRLVLGSAGLAEVWLPKPDGTVAVTFTDGVGTAVLAVENGAPFGVRFGAGAGSVQTPWTANNGTAAGTVLREPGFRWARDRYVIRARSGLGALVIRRRQSSPVPDDGR